MELGTKIRAPMKVVTVHPHAERPWVTLENGELVYGDVLVGWDGSAWKGWVTRTEILKAFGQVDVVESAGIQLYAYVHSGLASNLWRARRVLAYASAPQHDGP